MNASSRTSRWRQLARVLAALALAGQLLQDASLPHLHVDAEPGLYNHEHDLVLLAGLARAGTIPDALPIAALVVFLLILKLERLVASARSAPHRRPDVRSPPAR